MAHGVNYYDTAYIYHGGKSEVVLGRALSKYPRDSFYIADKFNIQANPDYKAQFSEQLIRLQTEYIDFYFVTWNNRLNSQRLRSQRLHSLFPRAEVHREN